MVSESCRALGTARSVIRELFEYGKLRAAEVGTENVYDFSLGNPSVPPPPCVTYTLSRLLAEEDPLLLHGYTSAPGDLSVRQTLAHKLSSRFGGRYSPDELYLTVGAAAALCCVFHGLCCPGDEFLVPAPYFPEYKVFIEGAGGIFRSLAPLPGSLQLDLDALERALTPNTKALLLNSPNNPAGVVYTPQTLQGVAGILTAKAAEFGHPIYLISDEPYREIVYDQVQVPWLPDYYSDTIVCYSYSKSLSLPGERIGYVLVPGQVSDSSAVYAAVCGAGRRLGYVNAPSLFQRLAATCDGETADLSVYAENRRILTDALGQMGYDTSLPPAGTFYYFFPTLEPDDVAFCQKAKALDLLLVPGSGFGLGGYCRLSFCVDTDRIRRALPAFEKLATQYRR